MNDILRVSAQWGFLAAIACTAFWGIWSLFGDVPSKILLLFAVNDSAILPISRWWDIPGAFLTACLLGTFWRILDKFEIHNPKPSTLGTSFAVMFVITFFVALSFGITTGFLNGLSTVLLLMFAFFAVLYFLAALKQAAEWAKDISCETYREFKRKSEETKTKTAK